MTHSNPNGQWHPGQRQPDPAIMRELSLNTELLTEAGRAAVQLDGELAALEARSGAADARRRAGAPTPDQIGKGRLS